MVSAIHEISHMDSQYLAGPICHPHVATATIFWYNRCCRGGGQAHSMIGATVCTDCSQQSPLIHTLKQIILNLLLSSLCTY
jgi:hypothetical protein